MLNQIVIIGFGFVGTAYASLLKNTYQILVQDPPKSMIVPDSVISNEHLDGVIICVPTPTTPSGKCDDSLVVNEYYRIRELNKTIPILIKSTTSLDTLRLLGNIKDNHLVFSPEFLTAKNAISDLKNSNYIIMSPRNDASATWSYILSNCFKNYLVKFYYTDTMEEAGLIKYTINSFLSTKVTYFNEIKELYDELGIGDDFNKFIKLVGLDSRMGISHMMVPGNDGKYGWSGACFPKDNAELTTLARSADTPLLLLETAIELNERHKLK